MVIYKDLYNEARFTQKQKDSDLNIYKDLFSEAQEVKALREDELVEMLNEVQALETIKENQNA